MFKYSAIPKQNYIDAHNYLCEINRFYNSAFLNLQHNDNKANEMIRKWNSNIYVSISALCNSALECNIDLTKLTNEQITLLLTCCDKIDKRILISVIIEGYIRFINICDAGLFERDWLNLLQTISAFTNFESALIKYNRINRNKFIEYLTNFNFPLKLFGKYGHEWANFNDQKISIVKLTLSNFPLDILNIIESFLPFEKPTEKSQCCIQ